MQDFQENLLSLRETNKGPSTRTWVLFKASYCCINAKGHRRRLGEGDHALPPRGLPSHPFLRSNMKGFPSTSQMVCNTCAKSQLCCKQSSVQQMYKRSRISVTSSKFIGVAAKCRTNMERSQNMPYFSFEESHNRR